MYNYTNNFSQNAGHLTSKKIIYFNDEINLFMERRPIDINNPQINNNRNVIVKASDILKKLRTYQDRKNFALENSKFNHITFRLVSSKGNWV